MASCSQPHTKPKPPRDNDYPCIGSSARLRTGGSGRSPTVSHAQTGCRHHQLIWDRRRPRPHFHVDAPSEGSNDQRRQLAKVSDSDRCRRVATSALPVREHNHPVRLMPRNAEELVGSKGLRHKNSMSLTVRRWPHTGQQLPTLSVPSTASCDWRRRFQRDCPARPDGSEHHSAQKRC